MTQTAQETFNSCSIRRNSRQHSALIWFALQCNKSKQCTESRSYDHIPVSWGYMRPQYPLLMALQRGGPGEAGDPPLQEQRGSPQGEGIGGQQGRTPNHQAVSLLHAVYIEVPDPVCNTTDNNSEVIHSR